MRIKVSSVADEIWAAPLRDVTVLLENLIAPYFIAKNYGAGVGQFSIFVIFSNFDDGLQNRIKSNLDKVGKYTHPLTMEKVIYISVALKANLKLIEFDPTNTKSIALWVFLNLIHRLDKLEMKIPKDFDLINFILDMKDAIEKSSRQL